MFSIYGLQVFTKREWKKKCIVEFSHDEAQKVTKFGLCWESFVFSSFLASSEEKEDKMNTFAIAAVTAVVAESVRIVFSLEK